MLSGPDRVAALLEPLECTDKLRMGILPVDQHGIANAVLIKLIFKPEVLREFLRSLLPCIDKIIDGCLKFIHTLPAIPFSFLL